MEGRLRIAKGTSYAVSFPHVSRKGLHGTKDTMKAAADPSRLAARSRANASRVAQEVSRRDTSLVTQRAEFEDNRPEAVAQRKLQALVDKSPQARKAAQLRAMADKYVASKAIQRVAVVQRAGTANQMWDDYFDAYDNLMSVKQNTNAIVDLTWRNYFYHLENLLYQAKDPNSPVQYQDHNVQTAHTNLMAIGVQPPAPAPSPDEVTAQGLLIAANARWRVFRGNPLVNRGAWAGSANHGPQPGDYVQTAQGPINVLRQARIALGSWFVMQSNTAPSGWSIHRYGVDARGDFIYHL